MYQVIPYLRLLRQAAFNPGAAKGKRSIKVKVPQKTKLTLGKARQIRKLLEAGHKPQALAEQFGVSTMTIYNVGSFKVWRDGHERDQPMHAKGEAVGGSKLKEEQVREIRSLHASGHSSHLLGERFGVSRQNIEHVVNHVTWKHVT